MKEAYSYTNIKREEYKKLSKFFIDRFNRHFKLSYTVSVNENEAVKDEDVDVYAISDDKENLNLQLKTGGPGLERFWGRRRKLGSGVGSIGGNIEELIEHIIKKAEQHYSKKDNLILLITEKLSPVFDRQYAQLLSRKYGTSAFRGIYLVKLPLNPPDYPYNGQVVAIKDIFGNNEDVF